MNDVGPDGLPAAQPLRGAVAVWRALRVAAIRFDRDQGFDKASGLGYASLLAIVPAALLAISLVELLDFDQRLAMTHRVLGMVFPPEATDVRKGFQDYLLASRQAFEGPTSTTGVRIFSLLTLVYFASRLLQSVDRVVAAIWGGGGFRQFLRRLAAYWAVVTLGPLLLALSFTATAAAGEFVGPTLGAALARTLPFGVTWIAVFLFFRLMPHSPVRTSAALAGAVVTGTLWEASKLGLGWYLSQPKTMLTTLSFFPAAILWMYVSWVIAVYGLEVAYVVHHRSWRGGAGALPGPRRGAERDALALAVLIEIFLAFDEGVTPDRAEIAARLGVADDEVADALGVLQEAGLAVPEGGGYRPARGAEGMRATDSILASRGDARIGRFGSGSGAPRAALAFLDRLSRDGAQACSSVTLSDLVREARRDPSVSGSPGAPRDGS